MTTRQWGIVISFMLIVLENMKFNNEYEAMKAKMLRLALGKEKIFADMLERLEKETE